MACKNSGVNHSSDESFSHVDAAKPSGNGCATIQDVLTTIHDSSVTIFCCKTIKTCMLQEEQKGKGTREQTAAQHRTHAPLQYSSVMERNGRRPHKRLIAKASGVWVRQGYRGAAEWG
ncbi:Uncharacterized protein HZ326_26878, partial [Fusarium oxysporum f. sp. albedinis]